MSEAPKERITHTDLVLGRPGEGYVERDTEYVRTDLYEEAVRQRDVQRGALRTISHLCTDATMRQLAEDAIAESRKIPPLARGDAETPK